MRHPKDYLGVRIGSLVCIDTLDERAPNGQRMRLWRCDCGGTRIATPAQLTRIRRGADCGCGRERVEDPKLGALKLRYANVKRRHKSRWEDEPLLPFDRFKDLVERPCFYCGAPPDQRAVGSDGEDFYVHGLDRMDNAHGYTTSNVVACCIACNRSKSADTVVDFFDRVARIYERNNIGKGDGNETAQGG